MIVQQMKMGSIDAVGNADRRVTDIHRSLKAKVDAQLPLNLKPTDDARLRKMKELVERTCKETQCVGELDQDTFLAFLQMLDVRGSLEDKCALFDRIDLNENGLVSQEELAECLLGRRPAPLTDDNCREALHSLLEAIRQRSMNSESGMRSFVQAINRMDVDRSGVLSFDEFAQGAKRFGVDMSRNQAATIAKCFENKEGGISVKELLHGIRGRLPLRRQRLIKQAFRVLDKDGSGVAKFEEVAKSYDASKHPLVINRQRTPADIVREFIVAWDKDGDGNITWLEFVEYYKDISAMINNDDYFELMIRNVWHISGGEGWCENTSNIRVLVTFRDGDQVVKELKDDIGIKRSDMAAIKQALEKQGLRDIVKVEAHGAL